VEATIGPALVRSQPSDRAGFAALVEPHWPDMARLARRLAPTGHWEDVLQEALSSAWRKRAQFDEARGTVRNWLLAIVADQSRKGFRRVRDDVELFDVSVAPGDLDGDVDLRRALTRLTRRQRTAVELHYYLGVPVADVADVLGCSAGTVKLTLSDARALLRRELGEDYRDE
jgi:DNA-directed RNA polymerase specialized sigma24 family protein